MILKPLLLSLSIVPLLALSTSAQVAVPSPLPAAKVSERLSKVVDGLTPGGVSTREQREKAYVKLLEGQRHIWSGDRLRSVAGRQNSAKLAMQAFQESVESDPRLSEGYTALAELTISGQAQDAEEAIRLARLAVTVNPNSFGARRILGRLYAFQSRLSAGTFNPEMGNRAIEEWKHVVRLDPRNAEGWAFLSALYERTGRTEDGIDALKKWLSSAPPVDTRFYQLMMGRGASLAPESASLQLGTALLKIGRTREAIEILSALISDDPANDSAIAVLQEALENANPEAAAIGIDALKQAVAANAENLALLNLLAQVHAKAGNTDEAAKLLKDASSRSLPNDHVSAAMLQVAIGDLMARAEKPQEAMAAYNTALTMRGIENTEIRDGDEREFAMQVLGKMIQTAKIANQIDEAKLVIERSRKLLGAADLFPDREMISLLRESGNRTEALAAVKAVRSRLPNDYGFLRLEATLLTETGRVDDAVALVRKLMDATKVPPPSTSSSAALGDSVAIAVPQWDAFSNYLFISNLYSQANRGKEAADAANQAYGVARGAERKQIARLTLATAQQMSGDFKAAEATLRDLLKETPGNPIALNNLGYFLLERDDRLDEAFGLIQQAVKIDPTNPSYLDSLGWAYFRLGKFVEAEKNLKEALRMDSSSGTIHEHLGDVYQKQGKLDLAKMSWSRALNLFSDAADLARVKKKLGVR